MSSLRMGWDREDEFRKLSSEELRKRKAQKLFDEKTLNCVNLILDEREREERKNDIDLSLKISKENVKSSKNLVKATWALVIVTGALVLVTLLLQLL